jgi:hypothetical protein
MGKRGWLIIGVGAVICACAVGAQVGDDASVGDATAPDAHPGSDAGPTTCNGQTVNTQTDTQNCGACGHACATGATCTNGTCECPNGQIDCTGKCANTSTDIQNCGKCGTLCQSTGDAGLQGGGMWGCEGGTCVVDCTGALSSCTDGCFDFTKDDNHCGNCTTACGMQTCCTSSCTDTTSDNANCGTCGAACTTGQTCTTSHCCTTGDSWCTSACVNTNTNATNCGKCGNACTGGYCDGGACCDKPTTGTCIHNPCVASTTKPLKTGCDTSGCVTKVCAADSYCCTNIWDTICVSEIATYCSPYSCSC